MIHSASWLLRYVVAVTGFLLSILGYAGVASSGVIAAASLVVALAFLLHVSKNRLLLLVGIVFAYLCYSVWVVNYGVPLLTTMFTTFRNSPEAMTALSSLLLFLSCLLISSPSCVCSFGKGDCITLKSSCDVVFEVVLLVILALILVYGFGRPDAIGENRGSPSAIYEYSMILFLLGFYFSGDHRSWILAFSVMLGLFALQNLIYGGRVTALQLLLILFFCVFSRKVSTGAFVSMIVAGLLVFTFVGSVRTGLVGADLQDVTNAWDDSVSRGFAWDTAYSSWHTSVTFVKYGEIIPLSEHLFLFAQWVKSVMLGGSVPLCNLAAITQPYFFHQFGGVLPVFFQFYLGPIGVILAAIYVSLIVRMVNSTCAQAKEKRNTLQVSVAISAIYVSVSCFRWILYSPSQITRGLMLCLICSIFAVWVDRQMEKHQNAARVRSSTSKASVDRKSSDAR